jgi:hypothetical protein
MFELDLQPSGYNIVAMFDGRVLEILGPASGESTRMHVKFLSVSVSDPDKKGRRNIMVNRMYMNQGIPFLPLFKLDDAAFEVVQPLLDALRNAGVTSNA